MLITLLFIYNIVLFWLKQVTLPTVYKAINMATKQS